MRRIFILLLVLSSSYLYASDQFYDSLLQQSTVLDPAKPGSLTGSLSNFDLGGHDFANGSLSYTLPLEFRTNRGPLLANIFPIYNMNHGLSEWGIGWQTQLSIKRVNLYGHINYQDDQFTSPWGMLTKGNDGYWYPEALMQRYRVQIKDDYAVAYGPNGETYEFRQILETPYGVFTYHMTEVKNLVGRVTKLNYELVNNIHYLQSIRYGGMDDRQPYLIEFKYHDLDPEKHWISFQSNIPQVHSRKIQQIDHYLTLSNNQIPLWSYYFSSELAKYGPGHLLKSVQRVFPTGYREPAVRFQYQEFDLDNIQYDQTHVLDELQSSGIQSDKMSFYDFNENGLIDIERAYDHTLFLQGNDGFTKKKRFSSNNQNVCIRQQSRLNQPRNILRIRGRNTSPSVVHADREGFWTICSLDGEIEWSGQLAFRPRFHENSVLIDLNGNGKPDLYRLTSSGYEVYANISDAETIEFELSKQADHRSVPSVSSIWGTDINGDGLVDIAIIGGTNVNVYMGKGNFEFTQTYLSMPILNTNGRVFDPSGYNPVFTDINQNGLMDLLLTQGKSLFIFINTGRTFQRIQHPAFEQLNIEGEVLTQNILGSGEQMIFRSGSAGVRYAKLNQADTNLLTRVDDGKGSAIEISYRYFTGDGNRYFMGKVVDQVSISSSMEGAKTYTIDYSFPYYRSSTTQRQGFDQVRIRSKTSDQSLVYQNNDLTSLMTRTTLRSPKFPNIELRKEIEYKEIPYQGLPAYVQSKEVSYYFDQSSRQSTEKLISRTLDWNHNTCPLTVERRLGLQISRTTDSYDNDHDFQDHLMCMLSSRTVTDILSNQSYRASIGYNSQFLPEIIRLNGQSQSLVLQELKYDHLNRLTKLISADRSYQLYSYVDDSDFLVSTTDQIGQVISIDQLDKRDLFHAHQIQRGDTSYQQMFRYNELDQLAGQWDDFYGSSSDPLLSYRYAWPSVERPGSVETIQSNLLGGTVSTIDYFSGSGKTVASLRPNQDGNWLASGIRSFDLSNLAEREFSSLVLNGQSWDQIHIGAEPLHVQYQSALNFLVESQETIVAGVQQDIETRLSIQDGLLLVIQTTNNERVHTKGLDVDGKQWLFIDEAGHFFRYDFDSLSRLVQVELPSGHQIRTSYDDLGRVNKISSSLVGSVINHYNQYGQIAKKTRRDTKGNDVYWWIYNYDDKARLTEQITQSGNRTSVYTYTYDGLMPDGSILPKQLGMLSSISNETYQKHYSYDEKGRKVRQSLVLPKEAISITEEISYDAFDRIQKSVVNTRNGTSKSSYTKEYSYDELGRQSTVLQGKDSLEIIYDEKNRLARLEGSVALRYDIDSLTDRLLGFTKDSSQATQYRQYYNTFKEIEQETYRLASNEFSHAYTYDNRGFLKTSSAKEFEELFDYTDDGYFARDPTQNQLLSHFGSQSLVFDDLGRMKENGRITIKYGLHGRAAEIMAAGSRFRFIYDEQSYPLIIYKDDDIYYLRWNETKLIDDQWIEPIAINNHIVGWLENGKFKEKAYDFRGTMIDQFPTSPYGNHHMTQSRVVDFAGHPYFPELGLVSMGVRLYDPNIGQFTSPDLYFLEASERCLDSPVECNLYSYAKNNPLKYVDPTGEAAWMAIPVAIGLAELAEPYIKKALNNLSKNAPSDPSPSPGIRETSFLEFLDPVEFQEYRERHGILMGVVPGSGKHSTPGNTEKFVSQRAAFRAAKRDANIPTSQSHRTHQKNLKSDALDNRRTATEFDFGEGKRIQNHPNGHRFPDGGNYSQPHFNNHGTGGTKKHYEY